MHVVWVSAPLRIVSHRRERTHTHTHTHHDSRNCRIMLGLAGVPSVIMFVGFIFLPESPRWLVFHGHEDKARRVLRQIRGHSEVEEELKMITDDYQEHLKSHIGQLPKRTMDCM